MRILILCAGQGTRLKHLTSDRPKCRVPLLGKPLLEHQTDAIARCGIDDITLVTGFAADQLSGYGYRSFHNADFANTNMVESLFAARALFDGSTDLIVAYSDIVYEPRVLQALIDTPAPVATVIDVDSWFALWSERMDNPLEDTETLKFAPNGSLIEIGKKPNDVSEIEGQYVGLTKFSSEAQADVLAFYDALDRDGVFDGQPFNNMYMTSFLQMLIDSGQRIMPARTSGGWLEVDTVEDLEIYEGLQRDGKLDRFWHPVA